MMSSTTITVIFLSLIVGGFLLESLAFQFHFLLFGKHYKKYHYTFARFIYYLLVPVTATIFAISQAGFYLLNVFLVFSFVGVVLEWLAGFAYHMVVGQKLWTYHRYSLGGYTSLFSVPLWGVGGVLFWLLVRIFPQI